MEFQFEAQQEHQQRAIAAIVDLFVGQPRSEPTFDVLSGAAAISNRLDLTDAALLDNLQAVQARNGLECDGELKPIARAVDTARGKMTLPYCNFSVEMETGTGKTYVYLRTALELYRHYGFRKFMVIVPSIAIREGVIKTLQMTQKHFRELYSQPYRYYVYHSSNLTQVRQFALSDGIEFLVMTIDAFNKDLNIINQSREGLSGEVPIHLLQAARPILILDEPQVRMEGPANQRAINSLCPLLTLRYSATHRNPYNRVYRLSPYDAYHQRLVKRIEVYSIEQEAGNRAYLHVEAVKRSGSRISARLRVHQLQNKGRIREKALSFKPGDALYARTQLPEYQDYHLRGIDGDSVIFRDGSREFTLSAGETIGGDTAAIHRAQINRAIHEHFRRQEKLRAQDIKVLTLFFIDRVAHYQNGGRLRQIFDDEYNRLKARYPAWRDYDPAAVQAAYFAQSKRGEWQDSFTGTSQADRAAYDLIMRNKERLLSFDEPVSFIFSHSALNEGWDNPNIFQICTLRDVKSLITKRQQIGRGVRLPVNQAGRRIHDEQTNVLTVIASEGYSQFVKTYQQEIAADYGAPAAGIAPRITDARRRLTVSRKVDFDLDDDFKALWEQIRHKTRYSVRVDSAQVIEQVSAALADVEISAPRITAQKVEILLQDEVFISSELKEIYDMGGARHSSRLPNLVQRIAGLLESQTPPISLSRRTILSIILESGRLSDAAQNPHAFTAHAVRLIKERLAEHLVAGIEYERLGDGYEMTSFESTFEGWEEHLVHAEKSVYSHITCDSDLEREFAQALEQREDIRLYVKLPAWFTVPTPVGSYNPDWAIVKDSAEGEKLYLVRETKGSQADLRPTEHRKTQYGCKHFCCALQIDYKVISSADELI